MSTIQADPRAFAFPGGPIGCLLLHGFTGSPAEMRPLGEYLSAKGIAVNAPLLAGHGSQPDDLNQVAWQDWVSSAEEALAALKASCQSLFLCGLSMGALLACHLALEHPECAGLILYAPALKVRNRWLPLAPLLQKIIHQFPHGDSTDLVDPEASARLWHYPTYPVAGAAQLLGLQRRVRRTLRRIQMPTLVFHSTADGSVHPDSARLLCKRLGASDRTLVTLHNSGHCMLVDAERDMICARSYGFVIAHAVAG
jgi:carboxylesterase